MYRPSVSGRFTDLLEAKVSQEAEDSVRCPSYPQIFIDATSEALHAMESVTFRTDVTLCPLLIVNDDIEGARVSNVKLK